MLKRVAMLAIVAALLLAATSTAVGFEVLVWNTNRPAVDDEPARLVAATAPDQLVGLFTEVSGGRDLATVDFELQILIGFDFITGGCVPHVAQVTGSEQTVTIALAPPDPPVACPAVVSRPAFIVALDRADIPMADVTVRVVFEDSRELATVRLELGSPLAETGSSAIGMGVTALTLMTAGSLLLICRRRQPAISLSPETDL